MKILIFDDVLVRRAHEYEIPSLRILFFAHADDAVEVVTRERPDVVLMDYAMQARASGEEAIRALRAAFPRGNGANGREASGATRGASSEAVPSWRPPKIVAISSDERSNERMLDAGADDAVPKSHVKGYLSRLAKLK